MKLADDIKNAMELEVRLSSDADDYFEAVFKSKDLGTLSQLLQNYLGEPLKPPGGKIKFPRNIERMLDLIGGIRLEQSFYLREESNGKCIYAALWPWQSDPSRITLKIGKWDLPNKP